jgi:hypothetical protein
LFHDESYRIVVRIMPRAKGTFEFSLAAGRHIASGRLGLEMPRELTQQAVVFEPYAHIVFLYPLLE